MKWAHGILIALAAAAWAVLAGESASVGRAAGSDAPTATSVPASGPVTTAPAEKLAALIRQIRRAEQPREAASAYARGCTIDRLNGELHNAYMRRMLRFGHPQIAFFAAQVLVRQETDNGLAWGVVGYTYGRRNKLPEALSACLRAAKAAGKDPSILHNAAQLIAWHEGQREPPRVSDATQRLAETVKRDYGERRPFAAAYRKCKAIFLERDKQAGDIEAKIAIVESEGLAAQQLAAECDRKLRGLNEEIQYRKRQRGKYLGELNALELEEIQTYGIRRRRQELRDRIRREEQALDQAETKSRQALREGRAALATMQQKHRERQRLRGQLQELMAKVTLDFRWDPPAVDGVVTPEAAWPAPRPEATTAPRAGPEVEAQKRLAMARLYEDHGMDDRAVEILREIVKHYGSTRAAAEAKALLAKRRPGR